MNTDSEIDIISLLEKKRINLSLELNRIEKALSVLTGDQPSKQETASQTNGQVAVKPTRKEKLTVPKFYDKNHKWDSKVLFILSLSDYSFKEDVVAQIHKFEPETKSKNILNLVSVKLSNLLKEGLIQAKKDGRKYSYFLL